MKPLTILALLAFAGCSAHNNLAPMPNVTQPPIEAQAALQSDCHVAHDRVNYTRFRTNSRHVRIDAPAGYWATSAIVTNDLSNGIYVRGGEPGNKRSYVPGHNETYGGKHFVKLGKHSTEAVMRAVVKPTDGEVKIDVSFCKQS